MYRRHLIAKWSKSCPGDGLATRIVTVAFSFVANTMLVAISSPISHDILRPLSDEHAHRQERLTWRRTPSSPASGQYGPPWRATFVAYSSPCTRPRFRRHIYIYIYIYIYIILTVIFRSKYITIKQLKKIKEFEMLYIKLKFIYKVTKCTYI